MENGKDDYEYALESMRIFWDNSNEYLRKPIVDEQDFAKKLTLAKELETLLDKMKSIQRKSKTTPQVPEPPIKSLRDEIRKSEL